MEETKETKITFYFEENENKEEYDNEEYDDKLLIKRTRKIISEYEEYNDKLLIKKARKIISDDFNGNQLFLELTDYFGNRKK